jgi:hypothetical protein
MWVHEAAETFETWFKAFSWCSDIAYDDCTRRVGRSESRPVLLLAATSGFNEVIEFGSFVAVCQLVAGDEPQLVTYDSVAGCMCFTQRWTILTCSSRQAAIPSHEFEKSM